MRFTILLFLCRVATLWSNNGYCLYSCCSLCLTTLSYNYVCDFEKKKNFHNIKLLTDKSIRDFGFFNENIWHTDSDESERSKSENLLSFFCNFKSRILGVKIRTFSIFAKSKYLSGYLIFVYGQETQNMFTGCKIYLRLNRRTYDKNMFFW